MDPPAPAGQGTIGLLLVHGIGEQRPEQVLNRFVSSFTRSMPTAVPDDPDEPTELRVGKRTIRIYEVYWADLLSGEVVRNSFDFETMLALPWFPGLNRKKGLYRPGEYRRWMLPLRAAQLLLLSLAGAFAYWGVKWAVAVPLEVFRRYRRGASRKQVSEDLKDPFREILHAARGRGFVRDPRFGAMADFLLDRFAADVLTYVASSRGALPSSSELAGRAPEILSRFHAALRQADLDGCGEIQILAHSLGTVVAFHALSGYGLPACPGPAGPNDRDPLARVTRIYTIGSPLEKIRFLWPQLVREEDLGALRYRDGMACRIPGPVRLPRWDNFVGRYDAVSGKLRRFGPVVNHRVRGGGFLRSHTTYERSPEFMDELIEGLTGDRPPRRSLVERFLRRAGRMVVLYFENLFLAPNLLVILVLTGLAVPAGIVGAAAQGVGFLLQRAGMERVAVILPYAALGVTMALIAAGVARIGRARAPAVHARYADAHPRSEQGHVNLPM